MIVIDAPSVVKSDAPNCSVTFDDTRSVDYDRNSFIIQATDFGIYIKNWI